MTIDKQQLQKLLWAEAASFRADCADWKRNTEALDEFLGEKTVVEVALELLAENERLSKECARLTEDNLALLENPGGRAMTDYTELQKAAAYAAQDTIKFADEDEEMRALQQFHEEVDPETVLALLAENEALKGPHDWLAEDLIKELVDNAQAIQENADDGEEDPFVIVLLASASRIRRQEANIDKLRAENEQLAKTADCWDRLNIQNKALSDSFRAERDQLKAESEALVIELPEPYAVVGDYAACGGGRSVWDVEYAEKIDDRMCAKTPVYDLASLEAAGVRVKP